MGYVKDLFKAKADEQAKEIKSIIDQYGNKKIEDVTLAQVYQGMRGITGLVTETSLLDANEGIRFRGFSIPELREKLAKVGGIIMGHPGLRLDVEGYTDSVGGDDYNQKLSEARSKSVLAWLTQHGIAADRLSFKGYGKTRPVATNDTDEGRAKNRRVEIAKPGCTK